MPLENVGRIKSIIKKEDKIKIEFSSNWKSLILSNDSFTDDYYYVGKELSKKEYDRILTQTNDEKYIKYAVNICNKKAYTKKEIIDKLKAKGAEKKTIERVVEKLKAYSYIDDKKFVEDYVFSHNQKNDGKIRIINGLKEKGISESLIKKLYFDNDEEISKAKNLLSNLINKHANKSKIKQKEAIISSLIRKGFTYDIALISYDSLDKSLIKDDSEKIKKAVFLLKAKNYEKNIIIKKLMAKGYKYNDILCVLEEVNDE